MKKLIFLLPFLIFSCGESDKVEITKEEYNRLKGKKEVNLGSFVYADVDKLRVIEIDSCEYIAGNGLATKDPFITHKGNCKFCAKRLKNEIRTNIIPSQKGR